MAKIRTRKTLPQRHNPCKPPKCSTRRESGAWFVQQQRWPKAPYCRIANPDRKSRPSRKRHALPVRLPCKSYFSVKTGSLLHRPTFPSQVGLAFYLFSTRVSKSVSSMRLHRICRSLKSPHGTWRMRDLGSRGPSVAGLFAGPVEEQMRLTSVAKEKNKHGEQENTARRRGRVERPRWAGVRDRATGKIKTEVVESTDTADAIKNSSLGNRA